MIYSPSQLITISNTGLTPEEFTRFMRGCNATYQAIGGDLGGGTITRADLMDVVVDSGHLKTYGERRGANPELSWVDFLQTKVEPMITGNFGKKLWKEITKIVFPHNRYEA